ncbi:MAG: GNAT family N-acetyltransferase [Nitrospirae bacterium]|nr:GNAT family N-acetyltransferase [Candidatus Manganitrophaceae bacterium]
MKTPLQFSDSREIDPQEVLALYRYANWSKDRTLEETRQVLAQSSGVFSLWEGPRLVAFARVLTDFLFRAAIYDVIVHPDVQRKGVGRALIYKVLTHPSLKKVPVFHLLTSDKRPFYEKLGFVTSEERGYAAMIFVRRQEEKEKQ